MTFQGVLSCLFPNLDRYYNLTLGFPITSNVAWKAVNILRRREARIPSQYHNRNNGLNPANLNQLRFTTICSLPANSPTKLDRLARNLEPCMMGWR